MHLTPSSSRPLATAWCEKLQAISAGCLRFFFSISATSMTANVSFLGHSFLPLLTTVILKTHLLLWQTWDFLRIFRAKNCHPKVPRATFLSYECHPHPQQITSASRNWTVLVGIATLRHFPRVSREFVPWEKLLRDFYWSSKRWRKERGNLCKW